MPLRRELPPPSNRIRTARLVGGGIQPLISSCARPHVLAQQELLEFWSLLLHTGRKAVLTAMRRVLPEEGLDLRGARITSVDADVA